MATAKLQRRLGAGGGVRRLLVLLSLALSGALFLALVGRKVSP